MTAVSSRSWQMLGRLLGSHQIDRCNATTARPSTRRSARPSLLPEGADADCYWCNRVSSQHTQSSDSQTSRKSSHQGPENNNSESSFHYALMQTSAMRRSRIRCIKRFCMVFKNLRRDRRAGCRLLCAIFQWYGEPNHSGRVPIFRICRSFRFD